MRAAGAGVLIFSKYFYLASLTSYYTFYLIGRFGVSVHERAAPPVRVPRRGGGGDDLGGPVGDRIGFKAVIWGSILGVLPFTLALPYANLFWTGVLTVPIGLIWRRRSRRSWSTRRNWCRAASA